MTEGETYVFDTGPLRHFTQQGWLGVLTFLTRECDVLIPESVEVELKHQAHTLPALAQVLDASWVRVDRSDDIPFLREFATFEQRLAVGSVNRGECGVLALGRTRGHILVIDDAVARQVATEHQLRIRGTLGLLCQAIREKQLAVPMVEAVADDLISGDHRLPFTRGGFLFAPLLTGTGGVLPA